MRRWERKASGRPLGVQGVRGGAAKENEGYRAGIGAGGGGRRCPRGTQGSCRTRLKPRRVAGAEWRFTSHQHMSGSWHIEWLKFPREKRRKGQRQWPRVGPGELSGVGEAEDVGRGRTDRWYRPTVLGANRGFQADVPSRVPNTGRGISDDQKGN